MTLCGVSGEAAKSRCNLLLRTAMVAPPRLAPPFTACNSIKKENYTTQVLIIVSSILGGLVLLCFGDSDNTLGYFVLSVL